MTELFEVKTLEEMPKALNFLIKKVDNLQETVNTLRHKQQASESPRWMNIDELCAYHPSHIPAIPRSRPSMNGCPRRPFPIIR